MATDRSPSPDHWDQNHSVIFPERAKYQRDACKSLVEIAGRYGAAFLCDGVGPGKTYVGLMVIERMIPEAGKHTVLFSPKAAREDVWDPILEKLLPFLQSDFQPLVSYSHTDLQRTGKWPERIDRTLKACPANNGNNYKSSILLACGRRNRSWRDRRRLRGGWVCVRGRVSGGGIS